MINNFFYLKFSKKINSFFFFASDKLNVKKYNFENYEVYFIGDIRIDDFLKTTNICKKIILNKDDDRFLQKFNSEFLIIIRDVNNNHLEVVNSRFASPVVLYSFDENNFILSNNLYILLRYREFKKFSLNNIAVWHFLKFRRIFGDLTLDKNTKFLEAGSKLRFIDFKLNITKYFLPNYKKNNLKLNENAELLNLNLKNSINAVIKDKAKISLALSGGADTRLVLANTERKVDCFNYTYLKNRESITAEKVASTLNHNFTWKQIPKEVYSKNLLLSSLVNSSMYMVDGVHYTNSEFCKYDQILSGYGLDFMFQGMYLPLKKLHFQKKPLFIKILKKIDKDIVNFFLENISYKTKGFKLENIVKRNYNEYVNETKIQLLKKILYVSKLTENEYDKFEYLSLSDYSRHYTYGGQLALSQHSVHSVPAYHNGLFDLSNQMPLKYKFDSKVTKAALNLINPKLTDIINANNGFKLKYNSYQITALSGLKKIFNPTKGNFHRTWINIEDLLRNELRDDVLKLEKSNSVNQIDFIDMNAFKNFISDWKRNKVIGGQTLLLILTLNSFLESIKEY